MRHPAQLVEQDLPQAPQFVARQFVPPAVLTAFILWRHQTRRTSPLPTADATAGQDRWGPFLVLTVVAVVRSVLFLGMNTFIALYWIGYLGAGQVLGGVALTAFLVGTVSGGRIADRIGTPPAPAARARACFLDDAEREHRIRDLDEACDIRTGDVITGRTVFVGGLQTAVVHAPHDLGETVFGVLERP